MGGGKRLSSFYEGSFTASFVSFACKLFGLLGLIIDACAFAEIAGHTWIKTLNNWALVTFIQASLAITLSVISIYARCYETHINMTKILLQKYMLAQCTEVIVVFLIMIPFRYGSEWSDTAIADFDHRYDIVLPSTVDMRMIVKWTCLQFFRVAALATISWLFVSTQYEDIAMIHRFQKTKNNNNSGQQQLIVRSNRNPV